MVFCATRFAGDFPVVLDGPVLDKSVMHASRSLSASVLSTCVLAVASLGQQIDPKEIPTETAFNYALDIVLDGKKSEIVDKRVGPIGAFLTCHDEASRQIVHQVVGRINDLFGYGKIALSESEHARIDDDAITIFVGSKSDGRKLVERFGVSSPRAFRDATYYYWWDQARRNRIGRCLIAIDDESSPEIIAENVSYLLLACMGLRSPWSAQRHQRAMGEARGAQSDRYADLHQATVRFFDKHIPSGATAHEMRRIFKREWPDFSAAYLQPSSRTEQVLPNGQAP